MILRLYLSDEQGRAFSFSDVGSGVGYVLPVVNAFCEPEKPLLVIQQPELHLHPALQSDLGDVLIAGTYGPTPEYTSRDWRPRELPAIGFSSRRLVDEVDQYKEKLLLKHIASTYCCVSLREFAILWEIASKGNSHYRPTMLRSWIRPQPNGNNQGDPHSNRRKENLAVDGRVGSLQRGKRILSMNEVMVQPEAFKDASEFLGFIGHFRAVL